MKACAFQFLYFRKALGKLNPRFFSCPTECPKDDKKTYDISRSDFCDSCDRKLAKDKFKAATLKIWDERLGEKAKKFNFEKVLQTLHTVIGFENLPPEKMSVKTSRYLDVYLSEKNKMEFIEIWNENQQKD